MVQPAPFGLTLADAIDILEKAGFHANFRTKPEGTVECLSCRHSDRADAFTMLDFERVEGVSDPADENMVAGIECPSCHARGTLILPYGALMTRRDAAVLSRIRVPRRPRQQD